MPTPAVSAETGSARIVLRPNRSLSFRSACGIFFVLALLDLTLVVVSLRHGAWPVAPYLLLQLVGIGVLLWWCRRRAGDCEILTFDEGSLRIERSEGRRTAIFAFQRYWARVTLQPVRDGWHPSRLLVRSHGREVEVGAGLLEEQRQLLARDLKQALSPGYRPAEANPLPSGSFFDNSRFKKYT